MRLQSCLEVLFCLEGGRLFMREIINSGNSTVDAMAKINLTGNIIPANWFRTITRDNGKPYMLAICILSELCYWYRPQEVRDERSGNIVEYRKRFRGDMLQKNYQDLADRFGESKRSVKAATDRLEELGVIRKEWRNLKLRNGAVINNVLFIDLNVDILSGLTFGYPESVEEISEEIAQSEENVESEEIENPTGWLLLNYILDPRTGLGRYDKQFRLSNFEFFRHVIDLVQTTFDISDILNNPDVKERVDFYKAEQSEFVKQLKRCSTVHDNVVLVNYFDEDKVHVGNRFYIYTMFPECNISIHKIMGNDGTKTVYAVGKSVINRTSELNVAELMAEYSRSVRRREDMKCRVFYWGCPCRKKLRPY